MGYTAWCRRALPANRSTVAAALGIPLKVRSGLSRCKNSVSALPCFGPIADISYANAQRQRCIASCARGMLLGTSLTKGYFAITQPNVDVRQTITGGPSYTCTLDIPGDWAHRCPPSLFASPPEPPPLPPAPYELGCPAQTVRVPGADGKDQTINILRC
jgi:hypothetical protein